ncbi:ATP-dependent helicase [Pseudoclavibacter sp. CFCC 13796]|uniref:ATP-dependent helicase n=1 Tax=Pseudoclavibacter sp. CFCC 13796 TaxID=2615179 RepID=UPI001300E7A7|nr:ATP-dependent DNA helicase [Pseudoclavibacter sp. CFCC 13796]KAB1659930.1 ATP-dependent helicase [Pseudoclavibacter sp. CFCC 13796]
MPEIRFITSASAPDRVLDRSALDASQLQVIERSQQSHLRVLGAPGTGKTTALAATVLDALDRGVRPEQILVIASSRQSAASLSTLIDVGLRDVSASSLVRTAASLAFEVLRAVALAHGQTPPRLLTGGEQDRLLQELLQGHETADVAGGALPWPPVIGPEVRELRGFRTELRELFGRAHEYAVTPQGLAELGQTTNRAEWAAGAQLFDEYLAVKKAIEETATAYDSSELVSAAAEVLADHPPAELGGLRLVLVDDLQESTAALIGLLRPLVQRGARLVTFGDPDQATNGFRGGRPDLVARLHDEIGVRAEQVVLEKSHRLHGQLAHAVSEIMQHVGTASAGEQRRALQAAVERPETAQNPEAVESPEAAENTDAAESQTDAGSAPTTEAKTKSAGQGAGRIAAKSFATSSDEITGVAGVLRRRHLEEHLPWAQMAIVTRSSGELEQLSRQLAAAGVPVSLSGVSGALRDEAVNLDLLRTVEVGCGLRELDEQVVTELLTGPLGGLDGVHLRRVRRALREHELAGGGERRASALLVDAVRGGTGLPHAGPLAGAIAQVDRLAALLSEIAHGNERQAPAVELLWLAWQSAGVADEWREQALSGGVAAVDANRRLDAVVALFASAQRHVERFPEADAGEFVEQQLQQSVPEDSLAHTGRRDAVFLGSASATIGLEFDTVVVMGLQDGAWPNTRQRNTLLGAEHLVETVRGQHDVDRRREVLHDELRMFVQALSRARSHVLLTTVIDEDNAPSMMLRMLDDIVSTEPAEGEEYGWYTLRGVVGTLRRRLNEHPDDQIAARALVVLAHADVRGASPTEWSGLADLSTTEPLTELDPFAGDLDAPPADENVDSSGSQEAVAATAAEAVEGPLVRVSPSSLQMFQNDPLAWFLGHIGVDSGGMSTGIGTLIHEAFQKAEEEHHRDLDRLVGQVRSRWGELDFETPWQSRMMLDDVTNRLRNMRSYMLDADKIGARAIALEEGFTAECGIAEIVGTVDRIEQLPDGAVRIIDLKTGKPFKEAEVAENLQLLAYQVAVAAGAVNGVDASKLQQAMLVFVGGDRKSYKPLVQAALDAQQLANARTLVDQLARGMAGSEFWADLARTKQGDGSAATTHIHTLGETTMPARQPVQHIQEAQ